MLLSNFRNPFLVRRTTAKNLLNRFYFYSMVGVRPLYMTEASDKMRRKIFIKIDFHAARLFSNSSASST